MLFYEPSFKPGDLIEWCDCYYTVLENNGTKGYVAEGIHENIDKIPSKEILPMYWKFAGEKAKLVDKQEIITNDKERRNKCLKN